ncbi:MAG: hypothetical protein QM702_10310 [Rubrivivax sp.]
MALFLIDIRSAKARIARLVLQQQQVSEADDGGQHIVEVVRHATGQLADGLHLLALGELRLELALLGHVEGVDVDALGVVAALFRARDVEAHGLVASAGQRRIDRLDLGTGIGGGADGGLEGVAARFGEQVDHGLAVDRLVATGPAEDATERSVCADDPAGLVEGSDGERSIVEEAREAYFGSAQGLLVVGALAAIEHQRAGLAELALGEAGGAMHQAHRETGAVAADQVDVDDLGADLAVGATAHQQAGAVATHDVVELERARLELGEVVAEPVGEGRVDVLHPAPRIGGEEAGRRVVEIVDGALQLEEGVVLPFAVAGDVLDGPQHQRLVGVADDRQGADADAVPERLGRAAGRAAEPADDADVLAGGTTVARGAGQPVDRLGRLGLAGKQPGHRNRHAVGDAAGELAIVGVDVADLALAVGDQRAERQAVDHGAAQGLPVLAGGEVKQPRRDGEQAEYADHREQPEEDQDQVGGDAIAHVGDERGHGYEERGQRHDAPQTGTRTPAAEQRCRIVVLVERQRCHAQVMPQGKSRRIGLARGLAKGLAAWVATKPLSPPVATLA